MGVFDAFDVGTGLQACPGRAYEMGEAGTHPPVDERIKLLRAMG